MESQTLVRGRIAAAWLNRAKTAVSRKDVEALRIACDAARAAGAPAEQVVEIWVDSIDGCLESGDIVDIYKAGEQAKKHGAAASLIEPKLARGTMIQARQLFAAGKTGEAVALAMQLIDSDSTVGIAALKQLAEPRPSGAIEQAMSTAIAAAFLARADEEATGEKMDEAMNNLRLAMLVSPQASDGSDVGKKVAARLLRQFEGLVNANAVGAAWERYLAIREIDGDAALEAKHMLEKLSPSLLAQHVKMRDEVEAVRDFFGRAVAGDFVCHRPGKAGVTGVMSDGGSGSFFRLTSSSGREAQQDPAIICWPSRCRISEDIPLRIAFRSRRTAVGGLDSSLLAVRIGSPTKHSSKLWDETELAPGYVTLYSHPGAYQDRDRPTYVCGVSDAGVEQAVPVAARDSEWISWEIICRHRRPTEETLAVVADVRSNGKQVLSNAPLDSRTVGSGRKMFAFNVVVIACSVTGPLESNLPMLAVGTPEATFDIDDVEIAPLRGQR
jgi:hypothetical protein